MAVSKTLSCVVSLEENSKDVYLDTTSMLLKLVDNILESPKNPKFRNIRLSNKTIATKLLPAKGAKECLLFMGFSKKHGLTDGDDWLELPITSPLDNLKKIKDAIQTRRKRFTENALKSQPKSATPVMAGLSQPSTSRSLAARSQGAIPKLQSNPFLGKIKSNFQSVLQYEDALLQTRALSLIPTIELEISAMKTQRKCQMAIKKDGKGEELDMQELMLIELLDWFKNSFFKWVDAPECCRCDGPTEFTGHSSDPRELVGTSRVEVYKCESCNARTLFPRYGDASRLLVSRRGRCGEWASCFTLLCRSLGWDARHVVDEGDHVWTEVYSPAQGRWLHCDPCENALDTPLMYEDGWGKELTYVLAYSRDDIQDVTWRYTRYPTAVLARRRQCREEDLLATVLTLRHSRQSKVSVARRGYLERRTLEELVELLAGTPGKPGSSVGRSSGSLAWRKARGETGNMEEKWTPHTWVPTSAELAEGCMRVTYSAARNEYVRQLLPNGAADRCVDNWLSGVFETRAVIRKEEKDWKMAYLAREEGSESGAVSWRFDAGAAGAAIDSVRIVCRSDEFHGGRVVRMLCDGDVCVKVTGNRDSLFETSDFRGASSVTLKVEFSAGSGDSAWQHAQLFRQSTTDEDSPFDVTITFRKL